MLKVVMNWMVINSRWLVILLAINPEILLPSHLIPSTSRNLQPTLATIPTSLPPASPSSSPTRPAINPAVRPSPIQQCRASPIVTSQQLQ
ncbi:hypothetical protein O181_084089 [Austropuccinia psidii MF-1]|uniref:Uncharacterized protein n=1 Tax=Austropuccinia psidii MF-1 TaxID=1389203 RepID=A0A9Q3IMC6_9BASI|nr:hypothetical protein [Austropuccinia psidii MF-1]